MHSLKCIPKIKDPNIGLVPDKSNNTTFFLVVVVRSAQDLGHLSIGLRSYVPLYRYELCTLPLFPIFKKISKILG
jgi:hypothetical protein